jgi:hypothetical protein
MDVVLPRKDEFRIADCGLWIADCVRRSQAKADCKFTLRNFFRPSDLSGRAISE